MVILAVLDANVIYPASLRDTLFRASLANLYKMLLTDDIVEEARRNLVQNREMPPEKAQKLVKLLKDNFDHTFLPREEFEHHITNMPINEKDRHVLAAAVASKAEIIVTYNLKDFPQKLLTPFEVEAQSPDRFLSDLFQSYPEKIVSLLIKQAENLRNPSITVPDLLNILRKHTPDFVKAVSEELDMQNKQYSRLESIEAESHVTKS